MTPKTAKKTARSPINGQEIPLGAHPGNTGGKKGRSGRKPDWLKEFCEMVLSSKETSQAAKEIMQDKDHTAFTSMWKAMADRAAGKPKESIELTGKGGAPIVVKYVHEDRKRTAS